MGIEDIAIYEDVKKKAALLKLDIKVEHTINNKHLSVRIPVRSLEPKIITFEEVKDLDIFLRGMCEGRGITIY